MNNDVKKWADYLNNIDYNKIDKELKIIESQLMRDQVVVVYGCSDDLMEMFGAMNEEFDCYAEHTFKWFSPNFVDQNAINQILEYVDDEIPTLYDSIANFLKRDALYITVRHPKDCQFEYETNIPCERFSIMEDGDLYCQGFVFDVNDVTKDNGR